MLLLFISIFVLFLLEIQPKPSINFPVELFIVGQTVPLAGWPVLEPPTAWPRKARPWGNCDLLHWETGNWNPAGGELPQRDGFETNTLFGIARTFWQTVWVTETLSCVSEHLCLQSSHFPGSDSPFKSHQLSRYDATSLKMCMCLLEVTA